MRPWGWAVAGIAAVVSAAPVFGQNVISAKSGLVDLVEGEVYLQDQKVEPKAGTFPEVKEKAVLRTELGRAEVLLNPGVFLRVGENSSFRMITNRLIDTRIEMLKGSLLVEAVEIAKETSVTVVAGDAAVTLVKPGIYRFDAPPARLRVHSGEASAAWKGQTLTISGGKAVAFEGEQAGVMQKFDKEDSDALARWSRRRGQAVAMANVSAANSMRQGGYSLYTGIWRWNPWLGMMTYIPSNRTLYSPYGFRYWTPATVQSVYYQPPPMSSRSGWDAASMGGYQGMGATSSGYSGTMASSSSSVSSSPAASSNTGSTSSAASGSSSIGSGASGGGSRGR